MRDFSWNPSLVKGFFVTYNRPPPLFLSSSEHDPRVCQQYGPMEAPSFRSNSKNADGLLFRFRFLFLSPFPFLPASPVRLRLVTKTTPEHSALLQPNRVADLVYSSSGPAINKTSEEDKRGAADRQPSTRPGLAQRARAPTSKASSHLNSTCSRSNRA